MQTISAQLLGEIIFHKRHQWLKPYFQQIERKPPAKEKLPANEILASKDIFVSNENLEEEMQIFFPLTPKFFPSAPNQPDPTFTAGTGTGTFLIDTID